MQSEARWPSGPHHDPAVDGPLLVRRDRVGPMTAPHRHGPLECNLVLSGTATYLLADRRYDLAVRSLVWLFPGQDHLMVHRSPDYRDWLGLVPQQVLAPWCRSDHSAALLATDPPGHHVRRLSVRAANALDALLSQVVDGSGDAAAAGQVYAVLAAWEAFRAADRAPEPQQVHPAVRAAMRLLASDDAPPDLPTLAARVRLGPHHLSRRFLRDTGIGVARFRNEQRLRRFVAAHDADPDRPLLEVAMAAGFGSAAQFHRVVRELTGTTPARLVSRRGPR